MIPVVHVAIFLLEYAFGFIVKIGKLGNNGIYMMLLPIGFNCMGVGFPPLLIAGTTIVGLVEIMIAVRRAQSKLIQPQLKLSSE